MLLAIISDSHDNIPNLEKFLTWANNNKVKQIIHCGDIAAPAMVQDIIGPLFSGPVHLIYGNVADRELLPAICQDFAQVTLHGDEGELTVDGIKIGFCHYPEQGRQLAETGKYDLVFYGHTHKPWEEKVGTCRLVNPGTLAGMFQLSTFALFDTLTKTLSLKLVDEL